MYKEKLQRFLMRFTSKRRGSESKRPPGPFGFPRTPSSRAPIRRPSTRRIMPAPSRRGPKPRPKKSGDFDDILKKLKDMGK